MIPGIRGRLVTASFAHDELASLPSTEAVPLHVSRELERWYARCEATLGPASSIRAICDAVLIPLLRVLGFAVTADVRPNAAWLTAFAGESTVATAAVVHWNESLTSSWRRAVACAIAVDARWSFCCNGTTLRIIDARRTWARDYLEFDLAVLAANRQTQTVLWALARAEAMQCEPPVLDRAVALSARHGSEVCRALGRGVLEALQVLLEALRNRLRNHTSDLLYEHSLTVLYRVLFLLFAEARGLVPMWHTVYRDQYSLDAIATRLLSGDRVRGLWLTIQAISRLAHAGCSAGELKVTAFNGRLFAPSQTVAFDRARLDDDTMRRAVVAVSSVPVNPQGRRSRITYRELDVEQLGAVYEQVLDYEPRAKAPALVRRGDVRKATGTFYTPRAITAALVRQTLEPLVAGRTADEILRLRVLDPAMGSGAFLVGACRYLATALEEALVREGRRHADETTPAERAHLRRDIATRCLFGVDLNPMAVQLARLSLWLATLSAGKPLSFLDHHLIAGNSLVGATPEDIRRQPAGSGKRSRRAQRLPLFVDDELGSAVAAAVSTRLQLTSQPDDSAEIVRVKEQTLAALNRRETPMGRWTRALDLWCAGWFWEDGRAPDRGTFQDLASALLHGTSTLPSQIREPLLSRAERIADRQRFLHWPLAFPEVFADASGNPLPHSGFDAIVGNPPWDMVRGDSGDGDARLDRREDARRFTSFVREAGIYQVESRAHANRYQLFVERALQLARPNGRIGLVLPGGLATDTGAAPLRRYLFDRAQVDQLTGLDNREAIFPIHRSVRFVLLSCTKGSPTERISCRFGITNAEDLERDKHSGGRAPILLTRRFLSRLSGEDDLGIPELATETDLAIVERISAMFPRLGSDAGWGAHFGRELNASDDRNAFMPFTGASEVTVEPARPVVEGKHIEPFRVMLERCSLRLRSSAVIGHRIPRRPRLAYRDIASATNRLTLIAAIIPARAVSVHTVFCLKTSLPTHDHYVLCALLNSFVANYLIRLRVNTHVTVSLVSRLPVPAIRAGQPAYERLALLSRTLMTSRGALEETDQYAELQALVAKLYRCSRDEFEHILSTFPLVSVEAKKNAMRRFVRDR